MDNYPYLKWLLDAILADWAVRSTIGIFVPAFIFFIAWVFGKERAMKSEKRKFFIGGLIITGIILYSLSGAIIQGARQIGIQQVSSPNFRCEIVNGQLLKSDNGKSGVVLIMKIVNNGSQSIAWKWHLKLDLISGQSFESDATEIASTIATSTLKGQPVLFPADSYFPNILLETAVSNGSGKRGWVIFPINDISPDDIERIGNRFTITFQDCDSHVVQASETIRKKVVNDFLFGTTSE